MTVEKRKPSQFSEATVAAMQVKLDVAKVSAANNFTGKQTIKGTTNDGTTNIIELQDSDNAVVERINTDGFYQVRYRDEYVGGDYVLGQGSAAPVIRSISITGDEEDISIPIRLYGFEAKNSAFKVMYNAFEIPHDIDLVGINDPSSGITMEMHVHWFPLGSNNVTGNVVWEFGYVVVERDQAPEGAYFARATVAVAANQQYFHKISPASEFPVPDPAPVIASLKIPTNGWKMGSVISFLVRRLGSNAGDTYGAEAGFLKAAMHVPVDGRGSRQRYTK
jgi:hypothetical protein